MTWQRIAGALLLAAALAGCAVPVEGTAAAPDAAAAAPQVQELDLSGLRACDTSSSPARCPIAYTLSAPARVRVRVVDSRTPGIMYRTLVDWQEREAGSHTEYWDGQDGRGTPIAARSVSVIVQCEPRSAAGEGAHARHPAEQCADLDVHLDAPRQGDVVSGTTTIRARLGEHRGMPQGEYHVVVYLEGRTAWDGRVQGPDLEQSWDTRNVPNGKYVLAVTFNDLQDHAGSDRVLVEVANP